MNVYTAFQLNIVSLIHKVKVDDMGDYKIVVTTSKNVTKSIGMRLRVIAKSPTTEFSQISQNHFYLANRLVDIWRRLKTIVCNDFIYQIFVILFTKC